MTNEEVGGDDGDKSDGSGNDEDWSQILDQLPDTRYTGIGALDASEPAEVLIAWLRLKYPLESEGANANGQLREASSPNVLGVQYEDGSGVFQSRGASSAFAVRTPEGVVVGNSSQSLIWPDGITPSEVDRIEGSITIPFGFVAQLATERTSLNTTNRGTMLACGTTNTKTSADPTQLMRGIVEADILDGERDESGVLLTHGTGVQMFVGWDSIHFQSDGSGLFGYVPFNGSDGTPVPTAQDALDLLMPQRAAAHEQHIRQGPWFLTPAKNDPEGSPQQPGLGAHPEEGSPFGDYIPDQWATAVSDDAFIERARVRFAGITDEIETPQGVFDRLAEIGAAQEFFTEARNLAGGICVRGAIRHRERDTTTKIVERWYWADGLAREVATVASQTA